LHVLCADRVSGYKDSQQPFSSQFKARVVAHRRRISGLILGRFARERADARVRADRRRWRGCGPAAPTA
jgi:hypothetical protein